MADGWDDEVRRIAGVRERTLPEALRRHRVLSLRAVKRLEGRLQRLFDDVARRIRRRVPATGDVTRTVTAELRRAERLAASLITRGLEENASSGLAMHLAESSSPAVRSAIATGWSSPAAAIMRGEIAGSVPVRLQLSAVSESVSRGLARELMQGRSAGESAIQIAKRLQRVAGSELERQVPAYIQRLTKALTQADGADVRRAAVQAFEQAVMRQGSVAGSQFTIRGATRRLLASLKKAQGADATRSLRRWVQERAAIRARIIARTETNRAFTESFLRAAKANPEVQAVRWNLSTAHPEVDICDLYAEADPDGLGSGLYKPGSEPSSPAHPNCLCFFTTVLLNSDGTPSIEAGEPRGYDATLEGMTADQRRSILGPGRDAEFRAGGRRRESLFGRRGRLRSLRDARAKSKRSD